MKCTILGCGGSLGVPRLLCNCFVCTSKNIKNHRKRTSVYIESKNTKILIDTSPDFKIQASMYDVNRVDALLYTHFHSDHISGIDDFKPIAYQSTADIPAYFNKNTFDILMGTYAYLFETKSKYYKSVLKPLIINDYDNLKINEIEVSAFRQHHGEIDSLGFRIGSFAYSTDFSALPSRSLEVLKGVETWVIDCLRYSWAPTHMYYEKTLDYINKIKPKRAILTHMDHEIEYEEFTKLLPQGIEPAYDGMIIEFA